MTPERPSLWRRLGPAERAFALVIVAAAIGGFLLIADGLYLKAKADHVASFQTHQGPVSTNGAPRTH